MKSLTLSRILVLALAVICLGAIAASAAEKPSLVYWSLTTSPDGARQAILDIAKGFEEKTGIKVKVEFITWGEVGTKYAAAIEAKMLPDIGDEASPMSKTFAARGLVLAIDSVIAELGESDFYRSVLKYMRDPEGHYRSLKYICEVRPLWYWKDILAQAGVQAPFETWDDWLAALKKLTRDTNGDGKVDMYATALRGVASAGHFWTSMAVANGGRLVDGDGAVTVNSPECVQALKFYCDLFTVHKVSPPGTPSFTLNDARQMFANREIATLWDSGRVVTLAKQKDPKLLEKLGAMPIPGPRKGVAGKPYLGGTNVMIFKSTKYPEEAKEFLKFLMRKDNYLSIIKNDDGWIPITKSASADPYYSKSPYAWPKIYFDTVEDGTDFGEELCGDVPLLGSAQRARVFGIAEEQVLNGLMGPKEALDAAKAQIEEIKKQLTR